MTQSVSGLTLADLAAQLTRASSALRVPNLAATALEIAQPLFTSLPNLLAHMAAMTRCGHTRVAVEPLCTSVRIPYAIVSTRQSQPDPDALTVSITNGRRLPFLDTYRNPVWWNGVWWTGVPAADLHTSDANRASWLGIEFSGCDPSTAVTLAIEVPSGLPCFYGWPALAPDGAHDSLPHGANPQIRAERLPDDSEGLQTALLNYLGWRDYPLHRLAALAAVEVALRKTANGFS